MRDQDKLTTHALICARDAPAMSAAAPTARIITVLGGMVAMLYRSVAPGVARLSISLLRTNARSDTFWHFPAFDRVSLSSE